MNPRIHSAPRLVILHAVVFSLGILAMLAGVVTRHGGLIVASGPCLMLSGILIWVGSRITFAGPTGDILRTLLGPPRVRTINRHALLWIVAGVVTLLWGLSTLRSQRSEERLLQEPLAQQTPLEGPGKLRRRSC